MCWIRGSIIEAGGWLTHKKKPKKSHLKGPKQELKYHKCLSQQHTHTRNPWIHGIDVTRGKIIFCFLTYNRPKREIWKHFFSTGSFLHLNKLFFCIINVAEDLKVTGGPEPCTKFIIMYIQFFRFVSYFSSFIVGYLNPSCQNLDNNLNGRISSFFLQQPMC